MKLIGLVLSRFLFFSLAAAAVVAAEPELQPQEQLLVAASVAAARQSQWHSTVRTICHNPEA
jgi:hypothetical protein